MQAIRVCTYDGPGAKPVIRNVPWPKIPKKGALIKVGACGVCGTDLHILKGHWPKPLPWPFTLGHEIGGVLVEVGSEFCEDFMSKPLKVGSKVMTRRCNDLPLGVDMLYRTRHKYPWLEMQTIYPFTEEAIGRAVADAMAMKTVKSTIVPWPELVE
jgi:NADPH:quinone reductase-like Zn-dependent oxidoreductase